MSNNSTRDWWQQLYDKKLSDILLESADPKEAIKTLNFLQQYLNLRPGQRILDQCCGTGRLALVLAKDHEIVGVDLIAEYIELAAKKAKEQQLKIQFFCDDAFEFYLTPAADIVINWWTSFGYSTDDDINLKMLKMAYESLKLGGYFALDFMNVPRLYRDFQPDVMTSIQREDGELTLVRHSEIDFGRDILKKDWHYFLENGQRIHYQSEVKLYSPAQISTLMNSAGFSKVKLFGDLDGQRLSLLSPRCIVVGQRL